ncbi:MAG: hypothetical protein AAF645_11695 [Myxococcota bacterium]
MATLFFMGAWLFVFPFFERLKNPNENVRFYMTAALVEQGSYEISEARSRWGWVNDAACVERGDDGAVPCEGALRGERSYYSVKAPLTSWLGVPGYLIARAIRGGTPELSFGLWWARLLGTAIPCAIFVFFFYRFLGGLTRSPQARDFAFIAFTFGSVFLGYSYIFASHATSAAFAGGAFMLLAWFRRRGPAADWRDSLRGWALTALAGFLAAGVTALEYPCFFFSVFLCLYALFNVRPWPRLLAFGLGSLVPTLLVAHFQYSAFDNPLSPGHLFVENPAFRSIHDEGFFGADRFRTEAAYALLFSWREGLFTFTPAFVFAFAGLPILLRRERRGTIVAFSATMISYLAVCFLRNWDGGWVIGPRYLVVVLPFMAMATAVGYEWALLRARPLAAFGVGLLCLSVLVSGMVGIYYPHVPPEIRYPLPHLVWPLMQDGRAPHTALDWIGITGPYALLPLAALVLAMLAWMVGRWRLRIWLSGAVLCAAVATGLFFRPEEPVSETALQHIKNSWEP